MSYRTTPAFAVGGIAMHPRCYICGVDLPGMPFGEVVSVCCKHGEDHDYEDGEGYCVICGEERDYGYDDDYIGFGSLPLEPGSLGVPASSMNGNAMAAKHDPARWANWVAFCNSWGHP